MGFQVEDFAGEDVVLWHDLTLRRLGNMNILSVHLLGELMCSRVQRLLAILVEIVKRGPHLVVAGLVVEDRRFAQAILLLSTAGIVVCIIRESNHGCEI